MLTVYKYVVDLYDSEIELPKCAKVLTVAYQGEDLCMWVEVDTDNEKEIRYFHIFGTGHNIPYTIKSKFEYVGTGFLYNGLVFHVYERFGL